MTDPSPYTLTEFEADVKSSGGYTLDVNCDRVRATIAEVERLKRDKAALQRMPKTSVEHTKDAKAEVERLRFEATSLRPHSPGCNYQRRGDAYPCSCMSEVERLREALMGLLNAMEGSYDARIEEVAKEKARAALAGTPVPSPRDEEVKRLRGALRTMLTEQWEGTHISDRGRFNEHGIRFIEATLAGKEKP